MTQAAFPLDHAPPGEAGKSHARRVKTGFFERYCSGDVVLDVGYSGYDNPEGKAALPHAIGIDLDFPGYDGLHLPFDDASVDTVFSSHCLEHIAQERDAIREWFRVLKVGGFLVCFVPHQALYEKREDLPSKWNGDHKRFYTPASLMAAVEDALAVNSFRLRHLKDNDSGFDYALGPDMHSQGCYEIELVIEKIRKPDWDLA
jgi:SAM-dependent methyltransferase